MLPTIKPSGCNYRCQFWTKVSLCGRQQILTWTRSSLNQTGESSRLRFVGAVYRRSFVEGYFLSVFFSHYYQYSFFFTVLSVSSQRCPTTLDFIIDDSLSNVISFFPFFISSSGVQNTAGCPSTILDTKKWWPTTNQESCVMVAVSWPNQRNSDDSNKLKTTYPLNASLRTPSCCSSSFKLTLCILHIKIKWGHKELT